MKKGVLALAISMGVIASSGHTHTVDHDALLNMLKASGNIAEDASYATAMETVKQYAAKAHQQALNRPAGELHELEMARQQGILNRVEQNRQLNYAEKLQKVSSREHRGPVPLMLRTTLPS